MVITKAPSFEATRLSVDRAILQLGMCCARKALRPLESFGLKFGAEEAQSMRQRRPSKGKKSGQTDASFGTQLTNLMKSRAGTASDRKWTDEALAAQVGVEPETIANWRRSRSLPTRKNYQLLLNGFGLDRDDPRQHETIHALDDALPREKRQNNELHGEQFIFFATAFPTTANLPIARESIETWLDKNVITRQVGLCVLTASGGSGKTTTLRNWISNKRDVLESRFQRVFLWSSYRQGQTAEFISIDAFFEALVSFLRIRSRPADNTRTKMLACLEALRQKSILIVADGVEALQYPPGEDGSKVGRFKDNDAQEFLSAVADLTTTAIIVTSRISD